MRSVYSSCFVSPGMRPYFPWEDNIAGAGYRPGPYQMRVNRVVKRQRRGPKAHARLLAGPARRKEWAKRSYESPYIPSPEVTLCRRVQVRRGSALQARARPNRSSIGSGVPHSARAGYGSRWINAFGHPHPETHAITAVRAYRPPRAAHCPGASRTVVSHSPPVMQPQHVPSSWTEVVHRRRYGPTIP